jgi:hypothetical protein
MTGDNIISMPTPKHVLAERIRAAHERAARGRQEWVQGRVDECYALRELRDQFSDNIQFSHWLIENSLEHWGKDDRAAMIAMARAAPHRADLEFVFQLYADEQFKPDTIWRIIKQKGLEWPVNQFNEAVSSDDPNTAPAGTSPEIQPETTKQTGQTNEMPDPTPVESEPKVDLPRSEPKRKSGAGTQWKLAKYPDADLVYAHVTRPQSRSALADVVTHKRGGRAIWELLVEAIKLGHYGPPSTGNERPNLRMILPWVPPGSFADSIEINTQDGRKYVRDIILPLLAEKPELKLDPSNFGKAVARRRYETEEELRKTRQMEHHASVVAKHQFQPGEQEIVAYGTPMWPLEYSLGYTYEELKHACWYANFFLNSIARRDWSEVSTGMMGRHLIKWIGPIAPGITTAIKQIFSAYELNPKGECKFPMTPVNFGID